MSKENILETLQGMGIETNAALNTGAGSAGDAVPDEVLRKDIMDLVPSESLLLPLLPGDQNKALGRNLQEIESVNIVGEVPQFQGGEGEVTGGFQQAAAANGTLEVGKVTVTQKRFELTFDITKKLETYSLVNFVEWIKKEMPGAMAKTLDNVILNGDTATAANTNINSIDGTPPATANYLRADGIRKRGLANNSTDVGALAFQDYLDVLGSMGVYGVDPSQLLWIFNHETYIKSMGITEFKDASENGKKSIIHDGSKALTNILGADLVTPRTYSKANAAGKVQTTVPAGNTLGGFSLFWLPGVQHGFGETFQMRIFDYGSRGVKLNAWFDWGCTLVDPSDVGIDDGQTVGTAYNATLV